MKLMWKLLLAVLVISILLPFTLLKGNNGNPLLSFSKLKWPDWNKATKILPEAVDSPYRGNGVSDTIYQWTDDEGNVQFSNDPPPQGVEFSVRNYDPNLNVIQSVPVTKDRQVTGPSVGPESKKEGLAHDVGGTPYSADGIKKLFEDVNNVEKLLNQRFKNQETTLEQ